MIIWMVYSKFQICFVFYLQEHLYKSNIVFGVVVDMIIL